MKKINENTKVTLTLKQLKTLVKEAVEDDYEDREVPGIPQEVEPAIDSRLCGMIADLANSYFNMDVDEYDTRKVADDELDSIYTGMRSLALKWLDKVVHGENTSTSVKEGIDDEDDEGPADVDAAIENLFDMYRACKVEPKVCNAIKADGEKTNIFLGRGNSVGGIAKALRDGRLLKVIGFN